MHVNWGAFPRDRVDEAHRAGVKVLHQVGSVDAACQAAQAGVDAIIVQGSEAGGHVLGQAIRLPFFCVSLTMVLPTSMHAPPAHAPSIPHSRSSFSSFSDLVVFVIISGSAA